MNTIVSVKPVVVPAPGRGTDLAVRVTAPTTGTNLPVVLFSHGYGESLDGYAPLADHWAANGLVVVQPTHLDSRKLALPADDPRTPQIWKIRVEDLTRILDALDLIESVIPGTIDCGRVAVAGHSWGAQSAGMLLGARVDGDDFAMPDPRVKAGVLLAPAGKGGLVPFAAEHFAFMNPDFTTMTTPALIVAGDSDQSALTTRGPDWFTDAYFQSPSPKTLLTLFGGEHSLGGITGYNVTETTDESPDRVALIQRVSTAYLHSALNISAGTWPIEPDENGKLESK
ncbi:alpha/beta hydrolase family protein [Paractinoplanes atraurantiacus]|uniref:Alpha/beta hydrolase family protein n=1 Tax=Paractinoplanes atraurantiacus TaxID=1036182 RepID=A0A285HDK7_9ACTN|nr:alpha/beta fold hydrolase [Actinoplanes atraurantiacus]SNY33663.1 Alpha/beta hydrolase family protein [Actinoplanes atraurantiacus]